MKSILKNKILNRRTDGEAPCMFEVEARVRSPSLLQMAQEGMTFDGTKADVCDDEWDLRSMVQAW